MPFICMCSTELHSEWILPEPSAARPDHGVAGDGPQALQERGPDAGRGGAHREPRAARLGDGGERGAGGVRARQRRRLPVGRARQAARAQEPPLLPRLDVRGEGQRLAQDQALVLVGARARRQQPAAQQLPDALAVLAGAAARRDCEASK